MQGHLWLKQVGMRHQILDTPQTKETGFQTGERSVITYTKHLCYCKIKTHEEDHYLR